MCWLGILCEMPLCFLLRWSSRLRKVFHKKRVEHWWSLPLPSPGGGKRWAAATCHWERCTLLVPWKDRGSSPHANQAIPTAGQLPSSVLLPLQLPLCVSPPQSVPIAVHLSLKHTQCPSTRSFCVILLHNGTTERASAPLLPHCRQIFTVLPWFILG